MSETKGYGLIIPADWKPKKWDALSAQEIIEQLKALTRDAFYRMIKETDIDIDLLKTRVSYPELALFGIIIT